VGCELTVLLPGLAGPQISSNSQASDSSAQAARALTEAMPLPGLSALLAYARDAHGALGSATADGLLGEVFDMPRDAHGQWGAAAVARQGALGDAGDRIWLRADPVHLHADMGRLIVFPPPMLGLDLAESSAICEWLNGHEHFPGPALAAVSGGCWLLEVDAAAKELRTVAPSQVHGEDADRFLPQGEGAAGWHARMNEIQMLLNLCPINEARVARGALAVNSVWFWGAGALTQPRHGRGEQSWSALSGDHDLLPGLAECMGLRARALPADGEQWSRELPEHGTHLLVLDQLQLAACAADIGAWQQALSALDTNWLVPLANAMRRGMWREVTLHAGRSASVQLRRRGLSRWLRRRQSLVDALTRMRRCQLAAPPVSRRAAADPQRS
jgi:hypothetical protein